MLKIAPQTELELNQQLGVSPIGEKRKAGPKEAENSRKRAKTTEDEEKQVPNEVEKDR